MTYISRRLGKKKIRLNPYFPLFLRRLRKKINIRLAKAARQPQYYTRSIRLMKLFFKLSAIMFIISLWIWGLFVEPYGCLDYDFAEIESPNWNAKLDGLKVALVSDIHAGADPAEIWRVETIVAKTNAAKPDLILLLGDYTNGSVCESKIGMDRLAKSLAKLSAPLGVYAVLGNHDTYYGTTPIRKMLADAKIPLLENSSAKVDAEGCPFYLAGIADAQTRNYFLIPTFECIPQGANVIFLSHIPDVFAEMPSGCAVMFSGHTHGGQIRLPFFGNVAEKVLTKNYPLEGFCRRKDKLLYTTRGLGTSRIPVRFMCTPAITIATIRREKNRNAATAAD